MIVLALIFPVVLFVPLLRIQAYFVSNEIVLLRVAYDLLFIDRVLFFIVFVFGIVLPACKMIASLCFWYVLPPWAWRKCSNMLAVLGKLSVLDIILIALVIVALKGAGVGTVHVEPGLHLYCVIVIGSNILNLVMSSTAQVLYSTGVLSKLPHRGADLRPLPVVSGIREGAVTGDTAEV
jgi:uncharacterized paraquat-inducible protein A